MADEYRHQIEPGAFLNEVVLPDVPSSEIAAASRLNTHRRYKIYLAICTTVLLTAILLWIAFPNYPLIGILTFVAGIVPFGMVLWIRKHTLFCPECGGVVSDTNSGELFRWFNGCDRLLRPKDLRATGGRTDLSLEIVEAEMDYTVRCLKLLMIYFINQRSTELIFVSGERDSRMYYRVDDATFEFDPPPPEMHNRLVAAAKSLWGHDPYGLNLGASQLEVQTDDGVVKIEAEFSSRPTGDVVSWMFEYDLAEFQASSSEEHVT